MKPLVLKPWAPRPLRALFALLFALCAFACLRAGAAPPAPVSFVEPSVIPAVGTSTSLAFIGVAKGDFNGDGHLDAAAVYTNNDGAGHIQISLGNGDGTFQTSTSLTLPAKAGGGEVDGDAILARDFNGDGKIDLAVTTNNSTILIFPGNGDGTFGAPMSIALPANANGLQAGDVNGDGKLDLVALLNIPHQVAVLMGLGNGTFATPVLYTVDANPQDLALADVDHKNGLDILVATYDGHSVDCLLNNGSGTFAPERATSVGNKSLHSIYVADFDGDGKPDVVVGGTGQVSGAGGYLFASFEFLKGVGDGTFLSPAPANEFPVAGNFPLRVASENVTPDLNGDGRADVVFCSAEENLLTVGYGDGKGGFRVVNLTASGGSGIANTVIGGASPVSFVFGGFTGQVLPDILVTSSNSNAGPGGLSLVRADPARPGGFLSSYAYSAGNVSDIASFALGDFLGNGKVSLAVLGNVPAQNANGVTVVPGLGDGTLASSSVFSAIDPGDAGFVDGLVSADFNGDGVSDLIFNATGGVQGSDQPYQLWSFGSGSGAFGNGGGVKTAVGAAHTPSEVADFNRDGHPDFAAYVDETGAGAGSLSNTHVLVYEYGPNPDTFHQTADLLPGTTYDAHGYAAGDFDGDGIPDLVMHTVNPERLWFYKGNGDGTFQAPVASSPGINHLFASATADLNGDGKLDLIFGTYGGIIVMLGNGDGTFQQAVTYACPGEEDVSGLALGDFNGDGKIDVAVAGARDAVVFPGNGDGTLTAPLSFATGFQYPTAAVHAADLNGDGHPDLVFATSGNANGINYSVLLNAAPVVHTHLLWDNGDGRSLLWTVNADGTFTIPAAYGPYTDGSPNTPWTARAVATGPDGLSHLLWTNPDGRAALWTVKGDGTFTPTFYGPYTDNGQLWKAVAVSVGGDNVPHLLWTNPDGKALLWNIHPDGTFTIPAVYGPYTDGSASTPWAATAVATGPDGVSHLLWDNADGKAALWTVQGDGSFTPFFYGPYTDGLGWSAKAVSVGGDGVPHLLWDNGDGRSLLWTVNADGTFRIPAAYGPYTDGSPNTPWAANAVATGSDGVSHLLWDNADGKASLWTVQGDGTFSPTFYGPYTDGKGWTAVAVSAGP